MNSTSPNDPSRCPAAAALCATLAWSADAPAQAAWPTQAGAAHRALRAGRLDRRDRRGCSRRSSPRCGASPWWSRTARGAGGNIGADVVAKSRRRRLHAAVCLRAASSRQPALYKTCRSTRRRTSSPITNVASGPHARRRIRDARRPKTLQGSDRDGQGQARHGQLRLGRRRQPGAPRGENFADAAGIDIVARPVQGRGGRLHRPDRRPDPDDGRQLRAPRRRCWARRACARSP